MTGFLCPMEFLLTFQITSLLMLHLIIDTSSALAVVALCRHEEILVMRQIESHLLSASLMMRIDEVLKAAGHTIHQLNFIACGIGPGSFTGTRIGVVSTKAMAYSLNLPIVDFYSPLLFLPAHHLGPFHIATDAKSKQVYFLSGTVEADGEICAITCTLMPIDGLEPQGAPIFSPDESLISQGKRWKLTGLDVGGIHPHILKKFQKGLTTTAEALSPLYLKSPSR